MKEFEFLLKGKQLKKLYHKEYGVILEKYELKQAEVDLLYMLSMAGEHDTARDMADMGNLSKAHVSKSIDHLRRKNMVDVSEDKEDRRYCHLLITTEGSRCLEEIRQIRQRIWDILYSGVTEEEKQVLSRVAHKMAENMRQEMKK